MVNKYIDGLVDYGISKEFYDVRDKVYIRNRIIEILDYDDYEPCGVKENLSLDEILNNLISYKTSKSSRSLDKWEIDRLSTSLMGVLMPRPSKVSDNFYKEYTHSPERATDYLYKLSLDSNYISSQATDSNPYWIHFTEYGDIEITINITKPEKSPEEIAIERNAPSKRYPKCLLCVENEGYMGRVNHPRRHNLRIVPINIANEEWYMQYSPYLYYEEHCIVLHKEHIPMEINLMTIHRLLDFVDMFPHYFIGSNADLPIVGGSILGHNHFQGGRHHFPMDKARDSSKFSNISYEGVKISKLKWPLTCIRIVADDRNKILAVSDSIIEGWRGYSDLDYEIESGSGGVCHNTITPILRKADDTYVLDLVLRNNRTTSINPHGIFHPRPEVHPVKRENIGIIEVMGLAVLPARLAMEMDYMKKYLLGDKSIGDLEECSKHVPMLLGISSKADEDNVESLVKGAIGEMFFKALKDCGVYKDDDLGNKGFEKFMESIGFVKEEEF